MAFSAKVGLSIALSLLLSVRWVLLRRPQVTATGSAAIPIISQLDAENPLMAPQGGHGTENPVLVSRQELDATTVLLYHERTRAGRNVSRGQSWTRSLGSSR